MDGAFCMGIRKYQKMILFDYGHYTAVCAGLGFGQRERGAVIDCINENGIRSAMISNRL